MNRSKEIDFLRGIAVLLVVFFHLPIIPVINEMGWIGVDLFFVLSGFLVSGLLFKEYLRHGKVNAKRFLIRRGFKIYPLFYLFMAVTFIMRFCFHESFSIKETAGELLFVRNYTGGYWVHTWSLSVEEHFYFLLVFGVLLLVKKNLLRQPKIINITFISIMLLCLGLRIADLLIENRIGSNGFFNAWARYVHTHFRIDSLLFGVLISYHYHLNRERFNHFIAGKRKLLLPLFVCGILPAVFMEQQLATHSCMLAWGLCYYILSRIITCKTNWKKYSANMQ
jgi:peptidoglycan/LPS O-acetylase OafA/YrhL